MPELFRTLAVLLTLNVCPAGNTRHRVKVWPKLLKKAAIHAG
jgi:hypothetical protein